jgi:hypothetical protein
LQTTQTEVTNISAHGFWILSDNKEYFLSFDDFPWFKDKTINDITNIQSFREGHLYWENLDVDLTLDMIEHPERYPLKAKVS